MFKNTFLKKVLGARGEKQAAKHLIKKGYKIVELNMRTPYGEVDIIASDGDVLVFVEVKLRSDGRFGAGMEAVTRSKQQKLIKSAHYFCNMKNIAPLCRFDVVSIDGREIVHIENAFIC